MPAVTADFIPWNEAVSLIHILERDGNHKMCLMVAFGCFCGQVKSLPCGGVIKTLAGKYHLSAERLSTHSFCKTFGRHYWEENDHSEQALIILSEVFRHQQISETKRYLGITNDEINSVYQSFRL
jgi:hypothetical protein